jgi:hypothetical protein
MTKLATSTPNIPTLAFNSVGVKGDTANAFAAYTTALVLQSGGDCSIRS